MRLTRNIILGLILVIIGVILGGNALGLFNINIFFKGWWTLFIIIPCLYDIFIGKDMRGNVIGLIIGILLLLACQNVIDFSIIWKLLLPIIIIVIGLSLMFKNTFNRELNEKIAKLNKKNSKDEGYCATFSGQDIKLDKEVFEGTNINAIFGGITLDLRKATIKDDVVINASAVFGGIDLLVPDNVRIKIKSSSIFGGVSNKKDAVSDENLKTIYVNASCIFGGVEIK